MSWRSESNFVGLVVLDKVLFRFRLIKDHKMLKDTYNDMTIDKKKMIIITKAWFLLGIYYR